MAGNEQRLTDEQYMARALELACNGLGWVDPNPMVGAVIVKEGKIIGEGWHTKYGCLHAEREAFAHCSEDPAGSTLYVTLEPCCHWGKTPPCTEAIIEHGIARVVVGAPDPNPLVAGKGSAQLRTAGIEVREGVLLQECLEINKVFFHYIKTRRPYVVTKYAMTLDGKIATKTGASKWITGKRARAHVHVQRHRFAAIMVGIGTVLADDPLLTCRLEEHREDFETWKRASSFMDDPFSGIDYKNNPIRIVLDSNLRLPLDSRIVASAKEAPVLIATAIADEERYRAFEEHGCKILLVKNRAGHIDINDLMEKLGQEGIDSVYVEGGPTVHAACLEAGIVNEVHAYLAPKIFGGVDAPGPVGGLGISVPDEALSFTKVVPTWLGDDLFLECEVSSCSPEL